MVKKQIVHVVAFLLVLCVVLYTLCDLFESTNVLNRDQLLPFYKSLPENTVDAVIIGTSGIDHYWMPSKAYEDNGMVMCSFAAGSNPSWLYKNIVDEMLINQNPKLVIIDIRGFTQTNKSAGIMDVRARYVLDSMPMFSANYIKTAFNAMEWINKKDESRAKFDISLLVPFVKYHSKWQNDDFLFEENFGNKVHQFGGYYTTLDYTTKIKPQKVKKYNPKADAKLDSVSEAALYDIIAYLKENDINALFVDTPKFPTKVDAGRSNRVYKILEEEGMDYIHFYSENSKNGFTIDTLEPETDFHDPSHVNFYGAVKFTEYFAEYLDNKYDFPDRRTDEKASEHWNGIHDRLCNQIKQYEKEIGRVE